MTGRGMAGLVNFLQSVTFAVVKMARHILLIVLTLIPLGVSAQNHVRRAMERARERQEAMARAQVASEQGKGSGGNMRMVVKDGDTTYLDRLPAVYILSRSKRTTDKQWRQYYKLVWRFARVYPYAQASRVLKAEIDSTLNAEHYGAFRKGRYISAIQKDLFRDFEGALREMTIQQGAVLLKLIDRETGVPPYDIIKNYKNGAAAIFWQGVAKMFENDLKSSYDPTGADAPLEELVQAWQRGEFRDLYWSLFWEEPPVVNVPDRYKK